MINKLTIEATIKTMKVVFEEMDKDFTVWEYRIEIKNLLDFAEQTLKGEEGCKK